MANDKKVVAVFLDPTTGTPCWVVNPSGSYTEDGHGEFWQFKGKFRYYLAGRNGRPTLADAIASAQVLYWELARGQP